MRKNKAHIPTLIALCISLTGCTAVSDAPAAPEPSVAPEFTYFPSGSATQNLPVFENIMEVTGAGKPNYDLADSIALLVETGFAIESMTHTPVNSKIGEPADSVSLAIEITNQCLIAQFSSTWLTASVSEKTVSGCLIGDVEIATLGSE